MRGCECVSVCATKRETERLTNRNPGHAPLQMHSSGRAGCPRIGTGPLDVWPGKQERRRNCFQTCFRRVSDEFQTSFRRVSDVFQTIFGPGCEALAFPGFPEMPGNNHSIFTHVSLMFHSLFPGRCLKGRCVPPRTWGGAQREMSCSKL